MLDDQAFFTALPLGFGVLHLLLYANLPRLKSNLYYGLFLVFIAATIYIDFQQDAYFHVLRDRELGYLFQRLQRGFLALSFVFGVRFFYDVFLDDEPRHFRWLAAGLIAAGFLAVVEPNDWFLPLQILLAVCVLEGVRTMAIALGGGKQDVWLIAAGFAIFAAFASYDMLMDFGLIGPFRSGPNAYHYGLAGLAVATSAYLARDVARTHSRLTEQERRLVEQETERRLLQADVDRVQAELEEARSLQLNLLPRKVPERADLDIAVRMQTAMEVGGDYYDFREGADGSVTIAIGDATGHGLRAGIMVAVAKSLFQSLGEDEDLIAFFERATRVLKPMRLGNLFMGLTLVRIRDRSATIAAAGMPPALLYRAPAGEIEQLTLKGMPLGAFLDFPYQQTEVRLGSGDTLLLMTDGLPELFDERREMLGLERVEAAFAEIARENHRHIISHLTSLAETWRGAGPQGDDITLIVVRER